MNIKYCSVGVGWLLTLRPSGGMGWWRQSEARRRPAPALRQSLRFFPKLNIGLGSGLSRRRLHCGSHYQVQWHSAKSSNKKVGALFIIVLVPMAQQDVWRRGERESHVLYSSDWGLASAFAFVAAVWPTMRECTLKPPSLIITGKDIGWVS